MYKVLLAIALAGPAIYFGGIARGYDRGRTDGLTIGIADGHALGIVDGLAQAAQATSIVEKKHMAGGLCSYATVACNAKLGGR